jgi:excisionase family DNA binding protein
VQGVLNRSFAVASDGGALDPWRSRGGRDCTARITELLGQLAGLLAETERPETPGTKRHTHKRHTHAHPRVTRTVEEAAERLGIGKTEAYAFVTSGELESIRIGRLRRIN